MPKIVDHEQRRHDIAIAACRAITKYGLDEVTLVQIAKESGWTKGMLAHYYPAKWDVILAALRLMHVRLEKRLSKNLSADNAGLADLLREALPIGAEQRAEGAAWLTFWGAALKQSELLELSNQIYLDWRALVRRCLLASTPAASGWSKKTFEHVISSIIIFMDGLSVKALTRPSMYPESVQMGLLRGHIEALLDWGERQAPPSQRQNASRLRQDPVRSKARRAHRRD